MEIKIVFSPSKEMRDEDIVKNMLVSPKKEKLFFSEKTEKILKTLQTLSENEIAKIMKLKEKLLSKTFEDIKNYEKLSEIKAISLYNGVAYKELAVENFDVDSLEYLENNLLIFSALYGLIKPSTKIRRYRLDMTMKVLKESFYEFWKNDINLYFSKNLENKVLINLASGEFSKIIDRKLIKNIIDIDFKENKNGEYKSVSSYAKQARGQFLKILAKNNIKDLEDIKKIEFNNYKYNEKLSNNKKYIFTR